MNYMENGHGLTGVILTGAAYVHTRPETFVLVSFLIPYLLKDLLKRPALLGFAGVNAVAKALDYLRASSFSPEWHPSLSQYLQVTFQYLPQNISFLFNPQYSNVVFTALVAVGLVELVRKRKFSLALLPVLSLFIYTNHFGTSFYIRSNASRYIPTLAALSLPAFLQGIRKVKIPPALVLLAVVPFIFLDLSETKSYEIHRTLIENKDAVAEVSNGLSMPIHTSSFYIFEGLAEATMFGDVFVYPPGSYIFPGLSEFTNFPFGNCTISKMSDVGGLVLHNLTCV